MNFERIGYFLTTVSLSSYEIGLWACVIFLGLVWWDYAKKYLGLILMGLVILWISNPFPSLWSIKVSGLAIVLCALYLPCYIKQRSDHNGSNEWSKFQKKSGAEKMLLLSWHACLIFMLLRAGVEGSFRTSILSALQTPLMLLLISCAPYPIYLAVWIKMLNFMRRYGFVVLGIWSIALGWGIGWRIAMNYAVLWNYTEVGLGVKNLMVILNILCLYKGLQWTLGGIVLNVISSVRTGCIALIGALFVKLYSHCQSVERLLSSSILGLWICMGYGFEILYNQPFAQLLRMQLRSFHERCLVWHKIAGLQQEYFWWGSGPAHLRDIQRGLWRYVYKGQSFACHIKHPHNFFLELKASYGMIGYLLIGCVFFSWAYLTWKQPRKFSPLLMALWLYAFILWNAYLSFSKDAWFIGCLILSSVAIMARAEPLAKR